MASPTLADFLTFTRAATLEANPHTGYPEAEALGAVTVAFLHAAADYAEAAIGSGQNIEEVASEFSGLAEALLFITEAPKPPVYDADNDDDALVAHTIAQRARYAS